MRLYLNEQCNVQPRHLPTSRQSNAFHGRRPAFSSHHSIGSSLELCRTWFGWSHLAFVSCNLLTLLQSILAIWLGWILPANHVPGYRRETPVDLSRRRSALSAPPIPRLSPPVRRLPTPVLSSNDATRSEDPGGNRTRRVYFLDSPVRNQSPKRKRRSPLAGRSFQRSLSPSPRPNLENSCRSSLSPSPAPVDGSAQSPDSCDISIAESESSNHSSRASLSLATHLPRVKSVFSTKGRRSSEISETIANAVEPMCAYVCCLHYSRLTTLISFSA